MKFTQIDTQSIIGKTISAVGPYCWSFDLDDEDTGKYKEENAIQVTFTDSTSVVLHATYDDSKVHIRQRNNEEKEKTA